MTMKWHGSWCSRGRRNSQQIRLTRPYDSCTDPTHYGTTVLAADGEWVTPAVSTYRLEDPILELAVNRPSFFQRIHHDGVEIYSSTPSFLLTGGGIHSPPVNHVYILFSSESGVALPIVLIPTDGGLTLDDLIRIEGSGGSGTTVITMRVWRTALLVD